MLKSAILLALVVGANDPGGWSRAKWGMTESQLLEAGIATRLKHPDRLKDGTPLNIGVESVAIGQVNFKAGFAIDPETGLRAVYLEPVSRDDFNEAVFGVVEELLVEKYGKPWNRDSVDQWSFPTTKITLRLHSVPAIHFQWLSLVYERRDPGVVSPI